MVYSCNQLEFKKIYSNGKLHGLCKKWHIHNGNLDIEQNYSNGKLHGLYREWRENGQAWRIKQYKNNDEHGIYIQFKYPKKEDGYGFWERLYKKLFFV